MPSIKKIKVIASPNMPKEDVEDALHHGLDMMHKFEDEMHDHPFGGKLISIGKPMMMGGLDNIMDIMKGPTLPHLMHHLDHHPECCGGHHEGEPHPHGCCGRCQDFIGKLCKCVILFLIWKIFEAIDHRCHGFSEAKVLRKFKHDLQEQYGKITKIHSLLNETTLTLNEDHIAGMKVKSLIMLSEDFNNFFTKGR